MQKANRILLLTIAVLIFTIQTSDSSNSSYIKCYSCKFESNDVSANDVCSNPAAHSDTNLTCFGIRCKHTITTCTGTDEECSGTYRIKVDRECDNSTSDKVDGNAECKALSSPPGNRKISQCICTTEKCNGGKAASKSVSLVKSVNSVALVTMVFALYFVSSKINN